MHYTFFTNFLTIIRYGVYVQRIVDNVVAMCDSKLYLPGDTVTLVGRQGDVSALDVGRRVTLWSCTVQV